MQLLPRGESWIGDHYKLGSRLDSIIFLFSPQACGTLSRAHAMVFASQAVLYGMAGYQQFTAILKKFVGIERNA